MLEMEVTRLTPPVYHHGEGPYWEESTQSLLFVDISGHTVHRWKEECMDTKHFDDTVSFVIGRKDGGYIAGVGREVMTFDWSGHPESLTEVDRGSENRFNDAKCDSAGRLWAGTMGPETTPPCSTPQGALYSIDHRGALRKHMGNLFIANGLAWTKDDKTFYHIDSTPRKIFAYDFDIKNRKIGEELCRVEIPNAKNVTSCCFGGPAYEDLYVTTARHQLTAQELRQETNAGSVFRVSGLEVCGRPPHQFAG